MRLFTSGIHRLLREEQATQDALEEALVRIHAELPRRGESSKFSAWAYHICLNEALSLRRSRVGRNGNSGKEGFNASPVKAAEGS